MQKEQISESEQCCLSLCAWAQCIEHGPDIAFTTLPFLLSLDCVFFLGQPWVRKLIARWHSDGDKKKVERLFFGTGKRGVNSLKRILEDFRRDKQITDEIDRLVDRGMNKTEAFDTIAKQVHLSPKDVEARYYKRKSGYDPLARLLAPA